MNMLDLTGLKCPLPLIKLRLALKDMTAGEVIVITADDPTTEHDFTVYCRKQNIPFEILSKQDGVFQYQITKAE